MTACINGCVSRPKDGEEPTPRQASRGLLCGGCYRRLEEWLRDIPVDCALLPMVSASGGAKQYDGSGRTKQPEAPAPLRLDVAALTEKRRDEPRVALPDVDNPAHLAQLGHRRNSGTREPGDELWYELPDIARIIDVLHTWGEQLRCELDPSREFTDLTDAHNVQGECRYMLRALDRLAEAPWVDEAMVEIRNVWAALTRAHGLIAGTAIGPCLVAACDGKVYRNRFTGFPECNVCHRVYEGSEVLKVQLTDEAASA